jgi:cell wall-associated NlpC family hydrolase
MVAGIEDGTRRNVCRYALLRVGYPYSQAYRNTGKYYDCSSLAYYACMSAGVDISYWGMNTAAAEAQKLYEAGKSIGINDVKPGDLIFYSTAANGRFMNITHVAIYAGNGMVVEALNQSKGVVYRKLYTNGMVLACSIL